MRPIESVDLTTLAPKKIDWDLKRDIEEKVQVRIFNISFKSYQNYAKQISEDDFCVWMHNWEC